MVGHLRDRYVITAKALGVIGDWVNTQGLALSVHSGDRHRNQALHHYAIPSLKRSMVEVGSEFPDVFERSVDGTFVH